ncbi:MAG: hypothetical protein SGARI_002580 [Bacillariaceae sp.]
MQTISSHSTKIQQDTVQKKLNRIQQSPELDMAFQRLLREKTSPKDAETIHNTVEEFWLAHEKDVLEFERRSSLLYVDLNSSFHDEAVPVYRPIQMAVKELTGELDNAGTATSHRKGTGKPPMKASDDERTERRIRMTEMYKHQGEGFSSRSMRSIRVAIDGLAGEAGTDSSTIATTDDISNESGGMLSFISGAMMGDSAASFAAPKSNEGLLGRLSNMLTQDLESEMTGHEDRTPLTQQTTPQSHSPSDALESCFDFERSVQDDIILEEDDDGFFEEAAEIAVAMRRRERVRDIEPKSCGEEKEEVEEESDPMKMFLRDPMLEVTMHNDTDDIVENEGCSSDIAFKQDDTNGETVEANTCTTPPEQGKTEGTDEGKDDDSFL